MSASSRRVALIVTALICCPPLIGCAPNQLPTSAGNGQQLRAANYPPPSASLNFRPAGNSTKGFPYRSDGQEAVAEFAGLRIECLTNHLAYLDANPQQRFYLGNFTRQDVFTSAIIESALKNSDTSDAMKAAEVRVFRQSLSGLDLGSALSNAIMIIETNIGQPDAPPQLIEAARLWVSAGTVTWRAQLVSGQEFLDATLSAEERQRLKQIIANADAR